MEYILLNTDTGERIFLKGPYTVDGAPGVLPSNMVELVVVQDTFPEVLDNRMAVPKEIIDLEGKTLIKTWEVIDSPVVVPAIITPRQLRLWLISQNIPLSAIEDNLATESDRVEWEYATEIKRDHPLVSFMAVALGLTELQVDEAFKVASSL